MFFTSRIRLLNVIDIIFVFFTRTIRLLNVIDISPISLYGHIYLTCQTNKYTNNIVNFQ